MNGGPSGFNNAPVTRSFIAVSAVFTVFFGIQGRSLKLGLSYQFPVFITSFFSRLSFPSMGNSPTAPARNLAENVPSYTTRQVERTYRPTVAP
ncbi:rhomboid-like protein 20 [Hibiscus syriacus]|uniref:rhomboid-like protein 20 n=1 Tax=Hibiscus syriacus TaxID=106335 RepID=UPI0019236E77|nr:rhomboid-like protein 20 [Hibiscus syriacus]